MPPSGLDRLSPMSTRRLRRRPSPVMPRRVLSDVVHGPSQLMADAGELAWRVRHCRTDDGDDAMSERSPAATVGSDARAGSGMNARSFTSPSPLTSPPTMGVNG